MGKTALCPTPEEMIEGLFRACLHEKKPTSPKKSEAPIDTDVETWAEGLRCPEGVLSPPPPPPKVQASRPAKELDEHRYRELLIRLGTFLGETRSPQKEGALPPCWHPTPVLRVLGAATAGCSTPAFRFG